MAKTTIKSNLKASKRASKKKPVGAAAHAASQNGERRSKKTPTLEELTVRSFRLAYEQHHRKSA